VEFALVVPLLLVLVLGIVEFGRAYNIQTTLSGAAREGVRAAALNNTGTAVAAAQLKAKSAAPTLDLSNGQILVSPNAPSCTSGAQVTVTINYTMPFLTSFFVPSIDLTGKGVMLCNG
jgi:Flp pilus assembly protein TadG